MNDTSDPVQQMVATAPAVTCNVNLSTDPKRNFGAGVGMACMVQFALGQTNIHDRVTVLINRQKLI